jgi:hypothetical protein
VVGAGFAPEGKSISPCLDEEVQLISWRAQ